MVGDGQPSSGEPSHNSEIAHVKMHWAIVARRVRGSHRMAVQTLGTTSREMKVLPPASRTKQHEATDRSVPPLFLDRHVHRGLASTLPNVPSSLHPPLERYRARNPMNSMQEKRLDQPYLWPLPICRRGRAQELKMRVRDRCEGPRYCRWLCNPERSR